MSKHIFPMTLEDREIEEYVAPLTEFSQDTLRSVRYYIQDLLYANDKDKYGVWVNKYPGVSEFSYRINKAIGGNLPRLPKRVSSLLYNEFGIKLEDKDLQYIGELSAQDLIPTRLADVTHEFTWDRGDFGDSGSCFFGGEYNNSRCRTLPALNASAIRLWRDEDTGMARCWAIPLPPSHPYHDTENLIFVLTNYYGESDVVFREVARLIAEKQTGVPYAYSPIRLNIADFYVNSAQRYILAPKGFAFPESISIEFEHFERGLSFLPAWALEEEDEDNRYRCTSCNHLIDEDDAHFYNDEPYCERCYDESFSYCDVCNEDYYADDVEEVHGIHMCEHCRENYTTTCDKCGEYIVTDKPYRSYLSIDTYVTTNDGYDLCESCMDEAYRCTSCEESFYRDAGETIDNEWYCESCAEEKHKELVQLELLEA